MADEIDSKDHSGTSSIKQPPTFNPGRGDSYVDWKNDLEFWKLYTKDDAKRHGSAVYLSLQGEAKLAAKGLKPVELGAEDGLKKLTDELDKVYLQDETALSFTAVKRFVEYKRPRGVDFTKF